ncbi:MAG: PQQ-dependent sugar dehydrogenase [Vicingaceae bacterium]
MSHLKSFFLCLSIVLLSFSIKAQFSVGNTALDTQIIASNLSTPWEIQYTSDSSLWFTERIGRVNRIDLSTGQRKVVLDYQSQVEQVGESGMLGMELLFTTAIPRVFIAYTYRTSSNAFYERISSFIYDLTQDTLVGEVVLIDSIPANTYHDGARIKLINNQLYITTGDAGSVNLSQDLNSLAGKVLRIDWTGNIPSSNPISGSPIYSWGHRNAQGLFYANNILYSSEHGPSTNDEINLIESGRNYGWPNVEGFCDLSQEQQFCLDSNVVEPIQAWTPTVATSDLIYYNHPAIPEWQNNLLLTTLKNQRIYAMELDQDHDSVLSITQHFQNQWGRLRDIATNQYGEIFLATNGNPNQIIKLYNPLFTGLTSKNKKDINLDLYPNPAKERVNIKSEVKVMKELSLFNLEGRQLLNTSLNSNQYLMTFGELARGIYLLRIHFADGSTNCEKLVVQP